QMVIDQQNVGEKDSALFFLDKLKALAEAHQEARVNYTHAAGLYYKRLQNFKAALPFLLENLHDAVQNAKTDSSVANLTGLAGACLNVGNTVSSMGDYKAAQRYHLDALKLFERVGNEKGISFCYQELGNNFL